MNTPLDFERQVQAIEFTGSRVVVRDNEEALVGAVLRGGMPIYQRVREIVKPEMFGNISLGEVWNVFEKLFERGLGIDTITVGDELERGYKLDAISNGPRAGRAYLGDMRNMGEPRHVETYAENVQDYHVKKILEEYGKKMVVWSANGRRSSDIMQDVSKLLGEIVLYSGRAQDHVYSIAAAASEAYDETVDASKGLVRRVRSGLPTLDKMLNGGYSGGQLVIVAGRPGHGKTALLLTKVLNMIQAGKRILFYSMEMTAREIAQRLIAQISKIDVGRLQAGKLTNDEWAAHARAVEELSGMRELLTIIDLPAVKIGHIRQFSRREFSVNRYDAIMIDYIQLAKADEKQTNRYIEIGEISRGLKALAKELDAPIIAAAQLSRAVDARADKRPTMSDLRESGDLEQDADIVELLYRPDTTDNTKQPELIVDKHRNGATGPVVLKYFATLTRFEEGVRYE